MALASFFDWDGTLTDSKQVFLMSAFAEHLALNKIILEESYAQIEEPSHLFRQGNLSYREWVSAVPSIYGSALNGIKVSKVKEEADVFSLKVVKKYLYPYTEPLVDLARGYGLTVAISGAPDELIKSLGERLGFSLSYGSNMWIENGVFTGKLRQNLAIKEEKDATITRIIIGNNINMNRSFGFGDTLEDLPLLSKVGNPVALNPNAALFELAKDRGWAILNSDDKVVESVRQAMNRQSQMPKNKV